MSRRGGILGATVFAVAGVAVLIGLGVWQLERRVWKENLIATLTARLARAPAELAPPADWARLKPDADEYTRVKFSAEFLAGQEALVYTAGSAFRPDVQGPGYWVFAPARLSGGGIVVVDRGFVPLERKDRGRKARRRARSISSASCAGRRRAGCSRRTTIRRATSGIVRDPQAIAAAKKWDGAAPFYIEQESPVPPGGLPKPGKLAVALPDNHMQYAITWFGLAAGLTGVYGVWLTGRLRRST